MKRVVCHYEVNDTSAMMKHIEDAKAVNKHKKDSIESCISLLKQIQASKKTKIETEEEKIVFKKVYELNRGRIKNEKNKNSIGGSLLKSMVGRDMGNMIDRAKNISDVYDKIAINLDKGKADKVLLDYIAPTINAYEKELTEIETEDRKLTSEIENFEINGTCQFKKTITNEIENPLYGAYIINSHEIYKKEEGWEWTEYNKLKIVEKQYPEKVKYGVSDEHPEYAVVANGLFDLNGKLLKAIRTKVFTDLPYISEYINPIMYAVCAIDYKNNKYNIKKEPEATQKWIRLCLELEKPKMRESVSNNLTSSLANAAPALGRTQKQQKALDKKAGQAMAEAIFSRFEDFDEKGNKYVKQLQSDHKDDFYSAYSIERIEDCSFKVIFINSKGESTYAAKITYVQTTPFDYAIKTSFIGPDHSVKVKVMTREEYDKAVRELGLDEN